MKTARCLDKSRLVKQRVETFQILRAITDPTYGWQRHPAVDMWRGYVDTLVEYGLAIADECDKRKVADNTNMYSRIANFKELPGYDIPDWLGNIEVHRSHQSNLLRKKPEHYAAYFPGVPDDLPYVWPV